MKKQIDWMSWGIERPVAEYQFAKMLGRRWRFDWAWLQERVAVEQEGGVWTFGRHTRGSGFVKDMEKYNTATLMGWRVFRFTPQAIKKGDAALLVRKILGYDE